ncbi:class I tRNA ligase family protein [Candidatus Binatia bacterium]|nr:class I tRNA ligase family protein [Candidatus Binatia bacterium]
MGPECFPHHENEIAQSEAACGLPFATHWAHVSFLRRGADKMSKSLGNFVTIRDALESHTADALRLYLLQTHYRSPLEFGEDGIVEAQGGIARMYETLQRAGVGEGKITDSETARACREESRPRCATSAACSASCSASPARRSPPTARRVPPRPGSPTPRSTRCSTSASLRARRATSSAPTRSADGSPTPASI